MLVALICTMAACSTGVTPTPTATRVQIVSTRWTALIFGELVRVDGCLRVNSTGDGTSYLLVWPPEYDGKVTVRENSVEVLDGDQRVELPIGQIITLGGGEVPAFQYLKEELRQRLPVGCPGPYWVVGDVASPMKRNRDTREPVPLDPSPTPRVSFPQSKPVQERTYLSPTGERIIEKRVYMLAATTGRLVVDNHCLRLVDNVSKTSYLLVWQPEHSLHVDGEIIEVHDERTGRVIRVGEEVYVSGGGRAATVDLNQHLQQPLPPGCPGPLWMVGLEMRPNLRHDSDLFHLDVISTTGHALLFLRHKPAIDEQVTDTISVAGKLVAYEYNRCLHLQTEWGPGAVTLLWPSDWSVRADGGTATVLDGAGQAVARLGDEVQLRARAVPQTMDSPLYRQLIDELPGDCVGATWLVDEIE